MIAVPKGQGPSVSWEMAPSKPEPRVKLVARDEVVLKASGQPYAPVDGLAKERPAHHQRKARRAAG